MAFGSWMKKIGDKVKTFATDVKDVFKHGWNKSMSAMENVPIVGEIASRLPKFDNSNNPVTRFYGTDGYTKFDKRKGYYQ